MRKMYGSKRFGYNMGNPPAGCKICFSGASIVVFITGKCNDTCYYCPISSDRRNKDVIYVDDERVSKLDDILDEAYAVKARGAAITGGDPLLALDKTINVIELLKNEFGENFHIHLYTSGRYADKQVLKILDEIGLDEIRFHPVDRRYLKRVELAVNETSMHVGVEVPVIPGNIEWLKELALFLERIGGEFMNLNELEVSESNRGALLKRGLKISNDGISVNGSYDTALEFLKWARENIKKISIRFCPAIYKDIYQLRNRFIRKASIIGKAYEKYSLAGTLQVIEAKINKLDSDRCMKYLEPYRVINDKIYLHPDEDLDELFSNQCISETILVEYYPMLRKRFILQKILFEKPST